MKISKKNINIGIILIITAMILISLPFILYLKILPELISNDNFINFVQKTAKNVLKTDLIIKNPQLKTGFSPVIKFKTEEISILQGKRNLLEIKNLDIAFSISKLIQQKIVLKKAGLDYAFIDVNGLMNLSGSSEQTQPSAWNVEWIDSLLYIRKCLITYKPQNDVDINVNAANLEITPERKPKRVHFDINIKIKKNNDTLNFDLSDKNTVFIKDKKLFIDNFLMDINGSKVYINSVADKNNHFSAQVTANNFDVKNVIKLLNTNLVIPNGTEILSLFKNIDGNFDFKLKIKDTKMNGEIVVNKGFLKIVPLYNLPVNIKEGKISLNEKNIVLKDFKGHYGIKDSNKILVEGTIDDYTKSVMTDIRIRTDITNEFAENYLSHIVNFPLNVVGNSNAVIKVNSIYDKVDVKWLYQVKKGDDILISHTSISPLNYDRALAGDLHFENNLLTIKKINYYIASVISRQTHHKPLLNLQGSMIITDKAEVILKDMGFEIPKPLPSEFLNLFVGQKFFKKGTVSGNLKIINDKKFPYLDGNITFDGVRIPSQRLSLKEAKLTANNGTIHLKAQGRFKKSDYKFNGYIKNELVFPIVVKDIDLTVDNLDVERILKSFTNPPPPPPPTQNGAAQGIIPISNETKGTAVSHNAVNTSNEAFTDKSVIANAKTSSAVTNISTNSNPQTTFVVNNDVTDENYTFDPNLLIVEKCMLNIVKGVYKQIKFGNLHANLTLNKHGILEVKSNKFDFADGISTLKVYCDLINQKFSIRLGTKDVNSDAIATSLLNLPREISGKASALLEFYSDNSLKLNGKIQFQIKDGTITKLGLVEYVLNFAALFRNPVVMISPSTLVDLVNIPEGTFNDIHGVLKIRNNIVERINIKSSSPQLSSFIIGRMNLENGDSALRIYTKFSNKNKGFSGFLRGLSLNSLAKKVSTNNRNENNYYAAEISQLPPIEADEKDCQIFLTKVDGDVQTTNFLSSLVKIK